MRHRKKGKRLKRDSGHRKALFKNLIQSLIISGKIETTEAKAKAVKGQVDKLITKAKKGTLHARRQIMAVLPSKKAANKLVDEIAPSFTGRNSGFTRMQRLRRRRGDDALLVRLEFINFMPEDTDKSKKKETKKDKSK
jgi:large subunit ribosomal protein L17